MLIEALAGAPGTDGTRRKTLREMAALVPERADRDFTKLEGTLCGLPRLFARGSVRATLMDAWGERDAWLPRLIL